MTRAEMKSVVTQRALLLAALVNDKDQFNIVLPALNELIQTTFAEVVGPPRAPLQVTKSGRKRLRRFKSNTEKAADAAKKKKPKVNGTQKTAKDKGLK